MLIALLIIVLYFVNKIEVNVVVFALGLLTCKFTKSSLFIFRKVNSLILVVVIGITVAIFIRPDFYDFFKDVVYFIKPILAIVFGFYLFSLLDTRLALKTVVLVGTLLSIFHIYIVLHIYDFNEITIHHLRNNAGLNNFIELISMLVLIMFKYNGIKLFSSITTKIILTLLVISFVLYFSRTMIIASLLMMGFGFGYHRLSVKGFVILISSLISILLFYWYLASLDISISATGLDGFLYKLRMAPGELFISSDFDISNPNNIDFRYLYDHWRGFEASRAMSQTNDLNTIYGNGFGSLIDLGLEVKLDGEDARYIPVIHNGFIYVLFKTGVLGLILYLFFLTNLFLKYNKVYRSLELNAVTSICLALVVFYVLTSFVITGIFNQGDLISLILGGMIWIQKELHSKAFKISNISV